MRIEQASAHYSAFIVYNDESEFADDIPKMTKVGWSFSDARRSNGKELRVQWMRSAPLTVIP